MNKHLVRAATATAGVTALVALAPSPALAASSTRTCRNAQSCSIQLRNFPGGTINIRASSTGTGTGMVLLPTSGNYYYNGFRKGTGTTSFNEYEVPAGNWTLTVRSTYGQPDSNAPRETLTVGYQY